MYGDASLTWERLTYDHRLKKFGRSLVPNAIYQDSALKLSWFWKRRFLSVFTIYGHGGCLD